MSAAFASRDEGQALVLAAAGMAAVLVAVAIGIDWTYGLAQRRAMQNAADSAALAGGRLLASSVVIRGGAPVYNVFQEDVACEARRLAQSNLGYARDPSTLTLTVEFGSSTSPIVWTAAPAGACPPATGTVVPSDVVYVRVTTSSRVPALGARLVGVSTIPAGAVARARISGTPPPPLPAVPVIREYDPAILNCPACTPGSNVPMTIWANNDDESTQHGFKGIIDYSRYSTRHNPENSVAQLISDWDRSGSVAAGTMPKPDVSGRCPGGVWDTQGGEAPNQYNRNCSAVNWLYYQFRGVLSTTTQWSAPPGPRQVPPPALPVTRSVCQPGQKPQFAPSCEPGGGQVGDWVETVIGGGGSDVVPGIGSLLRDRGVVTPLSNTVITQGPNRGRLHGKAMTLNVYLWDCAENYRGNDTWDLILVNGDCSRLFGPGDPTPDRLHLFTVTSFTVYQGLLSVNEIQGYFGGVLADPSTCRDCAVNPFANAVALVDDP
ncbi:MAG TPA: pilus assembly protein TadG-related protein [Candidatus Limnocylindria bacterium]|nr:pilus assembly protein TadG-related protein [Candidatus Limnocylindria bacterium]